MTRRLILKTITKRNFVLHGKLVGFGYSTQTHSGRDLNRQLKELLDDLDQQPTQADTSTYARLLQQCGSMGALAEGRRVHELINRNGLEMDGFLGNNLLNMYCKCGSVEEARMVFDRMKDRNVVSWTAMIGTYAQNGYRNEAFYLFHQMHLQGVMPNQVTYVAILSACANLSEVKLVQARVTSSGFDLNTVLGTALVNMYGKCGSFEQARKKFYEIPHQDAVLWNAMITLLADHEHYQEALQLFRRMQLEGIMLNKVTCVAVLNACSNPGDIAEGMAIHSSVLECGYESDVIVGTALVNMYGKCRKLDDAEELFGRMDQRDVISWNAMITAYTRNGNNREAFKCFRQMVLLGAMPSRITFVAILNACASPLDLVEGEMIAEVVTESGFATDMVTGTAVMNMYGKCGSLPAAAWTFDNLHQRNVITWNSIYALYVEDGQSDAALQKFGRMLQEGVKPDIVTFVTIFNACTSSATLEAGKLVHACFIDSGLKPDTAVENAIVNMYAKCGNLEDAHRIFSVMHARNVISWTAMISVSAQLGRNKEAMKMFEEMLLEGVAPNEIAFITILNACASLASLKRTRMIQACILETEFTMDVEVSNVLLGTFGKCGSLEDASRMFEDMSARDQVSWNTLIAANAQHGHGEEGLHLFRRMQLDGVEPNSITSVSVLSACSHAGLVAEGYSHFLFMNEDHDLPAAAEHYGCVVDLLSRAGWLDKAEEFLKRISFPGGATTPWVALLAGCKVHGDLERAKRTTQNILALDSQATAPYVVMHNLYAGAGKWVDAATVRKTMVDMGPKKEPGLSWIEIKSRVHEFKVGSRTHPQTTEIYAELERLGKQMKAAGYVPDTKSIFYDVEEEQKDSLLGHHSEKLAIVFGLISTPPQVPIRIIKNLRVCSDCHTATKFISKIVGREIVVRDAHRFHYFKDGECSCQDYW